ncbi:MAG: radical SAM family heme chaperone HemW [Ruminococcaceae bacterium]|nr:radical SAM family heme chaperone HemW [Oscillospiraceae bacterium]
MSFFLSRRDSEEKLLGIYIHIPFCRSKCEYCDFYSVGGSWERRLTDDYLQALADHIRETGLLTPDYTVDTIYFGGGTPSYFGADNLCRIMDELHRSFRFAHAMEVTLEANPDSVDAKSLRKLVRAGFNRISIGVQSDDDAMLKKLGRPHTFHQAKQAMEMARKAGFANISLDLMYGLPNQTRTAWQSTLKHVAELRPEHLSCYALKVEEGTPLWDYKDCAGLPDDDAQADMYFDTCEILRQYGFEHYEISNFCKKGFESKHNMKYWTGGEYLGFGPTAASDFAGKRFTAVRSLQGYIDGIRGKGQILSECEEIAARERAGEYVMLRLRTAEGIQAKEYERKYLMPFEPLLELLERLESKELAVIEKGRWRLTDKGFLVSNRIIMAMHEAQERSVPLTKKR